MSTIHNEGDLLVLFDNLMTDYVLSEMIMSADQFRAVIFKYSLQDEDERNEFNKVLEEVCSCLIEIYETH